MRKLNFCQILIRLKKLLEIKITLTYTTKKQIQKVWKKIKHQNYSTKYSESSIHREKEYTREESSLQKYWKTCKQYADIHLNKWMTSTIVLQKTFHSTPLLE